MKRVFIIRDKTPEREEAGARVRTPERARGAKVANAQPKPRFMISSKSPERAKAAKEKTPEQPKSRFTISSKSPEKNKK